MSNDPGFSLKNFKQIDLAHKDSDLAARFILQDKASWRALENGSGIYTNTSLMSVAQVDKLEKVIEEFGFKPRQGMDDKIGQYVWLNAKDSKTLIECMNGERNFAILRKGAAMRGEFNAKGVDAVKDGVKAAVANPQSVPVVPHDMKDTPRAFSKPEWNAITIKGVDCLYKDASGMSDNAVMDMLSSMQKSDLKGRVTFDKNMDQIVYVAASDKDKLDAWQKSDAKTERAAKAPAGMKLS